MPASVVCVVTSCSLDGPLGHVRRSSRFASQARNAFALTPGSLLCRRRHYVRGALRLRVKDGVRPDLQKGRQAADCQQHVRVQSLQPSAFSLSPPSPHSDAAASQRRASEQIFRVECGRRRVQTRWLTSAAGAGDSEPDPLHLLAAAERDDTPPSHPLPDVGVASKTATDFASQLGGSRGSCVLWLPWSLVRRRLGFVRNEFRQNKSAWEARRSKLHTSTYYFDYSLRKGLSDMKKCTGCTETETSELSFRVVAEVDNESEHHCLCFVYQILKR